MADSPSDCRDCAHRFKFKFTESDNGPVECVGWDVGGDERRQRGDHLRSADFVGRHDRFGQDRCMILRVGEDRQNQVGRLGRLFRTGDGPEDRSPGFGRFIAGKKRYQRSKQLGVGKHRGPL
jgi:hypothetical protein